MVLEIKPGLAARQAIALPAILWIQLLDLAPESSFQEN